jgi:cell fate regulator YaaT (PSP1 superfamily)
MSCSGCGTAKEGGIPRGCGNNGHCSSGGCSKMHVYDWLSDLGKAPGSDFDVYEVSFKDGARKGFFRNSKGVEIYTGDYVVVEAQAGYDIGRISLGGPLVKIQMKKRNVAPDSEDIKAIWRVAGEEELKLMEHSRAREKETMLKARVLARSLGLDMKLGDVEYQADGKKATFYYTADGRVDFRELIKVLAREFNVKIEMRQVGARQEAGRVGGIGACGRELCCSTWLTSFRTVNTTAARYQNLSINQSKLSGQCGRLKCCLNYELDTYLEALEQFPKGAETIETEAGTAKLMKTDILKRQMTYAYSSSGTWYPVPVETVRKIVALNKEGKKPADLLEVAVITQKEEVVEFVDVVGHVSLKSLESTDRRNRNKRKKGGGGGNPNAQNNQSNRPPQGNRPEGGNTPMGNRPQQGGNRPSQGNRPEGGNTPGGNAPRDNTSKGDRPPGGNRPPRRNRPPRGNRPGGGEGNAPQ